MRLGFFAGTAALALTIAASPALAQRPPAPQGAPPQTPSPRQPETTDPHGAGPARSDQAFVMEAAKGGLAEVELGRLAVEKASSAPVKKFGQRMVDDHGKANDELKELGQKKNINVPSAPDSKARSLHDKLSKLSGPEFDQAYMRAMVADHKKDVNAFRRESQNGQDADLKAWAAKALPTLEDHLKMAEQANKEAVATSGTSPGQRDRNKSRSDSHDQTDRNKDKSDNSAPPER